VRKHAVLMGVSCFLRISWSGLCCLRPIPSLKNKDRNHGALLKANFFTSPGQSHFRRKKFGRSPSYFFAAP